LCRTWRRSWRACASEGDVLVNKPSIAGWAHAHSARKSVAARDLFLHAAAAGIFTLPAARSRACFFPRAARRACLPYPPLVLYTAARINALLLHAHHLPCAVITRASAAYACGAGRCGMGSVVASIMVRTTREYGVAAKSGSASSSSISCSARDGRYGVVNMATVRI